ncbi:MAG: 50S ribosomal protein L15 [bacterium]|nr:50S ribosomal protein L15 [bacterium]
MQIHEIKPIKRKKKKTVGRGGKRGTYSGRGNKGQKARSGAKIDPLFEGGRSSLVERLKKVRGFKSPHAKKININLNDIEKNFKDGDTVDVKSLIESGLIGEIESRKGVKILGMGKLTKKVTIDKDILLSKSAASAINK